MGPLDETIRLLDGQPSSLQQLFRVRRSPQGATVHRAGMQAQIRESGDAFVEVAYEHAPHEQTRERLLPAEAVRLLMAVIQRDNLCKIDRSSAEHLHAREAALRADSNVQMD